MPEPLLRYSTLMLCLICLGSLSAGAQTDSVMVTDDGSHWNGEWIAEGTLFRVAVTVQDNVLELAEVQSLGFVWSAQPGTISGNQATIQAQYAGATALLQVNLLEADRAVVEAASCTPEFLVVCVLAKGQQAVFIRSPAAP